MLRCYLQHTLRRANLETPWIMRSMCSQRDTCTGMVGPGWRRIHHVPILLPFWAWWASAILPIIIYLCHHSSIWILCGLDTMTWESRYWRNGFGSCTKLHISGTANLLHRGFRIEISELSRLQSLVSLHKLVSLSTLISGGRVFLDNRPAVFLEKRSPSISRSLEHLPPSYFYLDRLQYHKDTWCRYLIPLLVSLTRYVYPWGILPWQALE